MTAASGLELGREVKFCELSFVRRGRLAQADDQAAARSVLGRDRALVQLDDAPRDRQAQPLARTVAVLGAEEGLEQARQVVRPHAWPVIAYGARRPARHLPDRAYRR